MELLSKVYEKLLGGRLLVHGHRTAYRSLLPDLSSYGLEAKSVRKEKEEPAVQEEEANAGSRGLNCAVSITNKQYL